ncbi:hypothetical protein Axi01nite_16740 [Actinoplanes xinjiangensis]|nr:hypothetical protein Axi01nite_16740 [Actinoplanes xinjiangensis]
MVSGRGVSGWARDGGRRGRGFARIYRGKAWDPGRTGRLDAVGGGRRLRTRSAFVDDDPGQTGTGVCRDHRAHLGEITIAQAIA